MNKPINNNKTGNLQTGCSGQQSYYAKKKKNNNNYRISQKKIPLGAVKHKEIMIGLSDSDMNLYQPVKPFYQINKHRDLGCLTLLREHTCTIQMVT